MDDLDVTASEAVEEENTENVLAESVTVDVNAGDDLSDNGKDDNNDTLETGDDVNCNDEVPAGLDEKLSMDLVVIVTTVALPLVIVREVTACEKVLLTAVGVSNTDESVTCDEAHTAGNEEETNVSWTDKKEDDNLIVESDCTRSIDDESDVTDLLVIIDTDGNCCDDIADDISCEELVPVIIWDDVFGTEDVTAVAMADEDDNPWVTKLEFATKEVENTLLVWKGGVEAIATDDEVMFTVQCRPVKFGGQIQV